MTWKAVIRWALVGLAATAGGWLATNAFSASIVVRFGGRDLVIPRGYFESFAVPDLRDEPDGLILRAFLPEFTARPSREPPDQGRGDKVMVSVKKRPGFLNPLFARFAQDRIETEPFRDAHGLRMFRAKMDQRTHPSNPREIYFAQQDQAVTTLIECQPGYPSPPCRHSFNENGLAFDLTYHMRYLPEWQRIQNGVADLLRRFEQR